MKWQAWNSLTTVHTKEKQNKKFYQKLVNARSLGNVIYYFFFKWSFVGFELWFVDDF